METVLVIGGSGNIGASAITAALRSNRKVLAMVRNQTSADKISKNVGASKDITYVEADVASDSGVKGVVDQVRAGKLPAFQHVYSCVGGGYDEISLQDITTSYLRSEMNSSFESNFFAYRDTISYLLEQKDTVCTWTTCTGGQGDYGFRGMPAITQGAMFSFCTAAARENQSTNVRFNEVYLCRRVEVDDVAERSGMIKASDFAKVCELILASPEVRSARIKVEETKDMAKLNYEQKFSQAADMALFRKMKL